MRLPPTRGRVRVLESVRACSCASAGAEIGPGGSGTTTRGRRRGSRKYPPENSLTRADRLSAVATSGRGATIPGLMRADMGGGCYAAGLRLAGRRLRRTVGCGVRSCGPRLEWSERSGRGPSCSCVFSPPGRTTPMSNRRVMRLLLHSWGILGVGYERAVRACGERDTTGPGKKTLAADADSQQAACLSLRATPEGRFE